MQGVIYLVWISLPVTLLFLGVLVRLRQYLLPREEDDPLRPKRIFQLTNFFFFCVIITVALDRYVLFSKELSPIIGPYRETIRYALLPALAFVGGAFFAVVRLLRPKRNFDRLHYEVHGSHPLFVVFAVVIFVVLVSRNPEDKSERRVAAGPTPETIVQKPPPRPGTETNRAEDVGRTPSAIEQGAKNIVNAVEGALGLGRPTEAPFYDLGPVRRRPDFNQEGFLRYRDIISAEAKRESVDPLLVLAVVEISSGFNDQWDSGLSEFGLMALPEAILKEFGARNNYNVRQNIAAGSRYLASLLKSFNGDLDLALAAYRAGENKVRELNQVPPEPEIRDFVRRVKTVYVLSKSRPE